MRAFNAPYSMILRELDPTGLFDTAVEDAGKIFVSTELGGGGTATASSAAIAKRGARNLLKHIGVIAGDPEIRPSLRIDTTLDGCFHFAPADGMVEFLVDLGGDLEPSQPMANIWPLDRTGADPMVVEAQRSGILAGRHHPGLIQHGDCLGVVAAVDR